MERVVWRNGEMVCEAEAVVSIYDSALMFGDMAFEMCRSFNQKHFKLKEHLERLYQSVRFLHIPLEMDMEAMAQACHLVTEVNPLPKEEEHRLMINVSRGLLGIYQGVDAHKGCNVIISDFPLRWTTQGMGKLFTTGINAVIVSQRTGSQIEPTIKCRSRVHFQMANIEAAEVPGENNWAILRDDVGFIAEGSGSNIFIVKNNKLYTPGDKVLRGITRQTVLDIAKQSGIPASEASILPKELETADEAFMTGTPFCLLPITSVDGDKLGDGKPGPIYRGLLKRFNYLAGLDIEMQIKNWDKDMADYSSAPSPYSFKGAK